MIRLCAFLGNVGSEYARNRHNVAWLFLDSLQEAARRGTVQEFLAGS